MSRLTQTNLRTRFRTLIYKETGIRMPENKDHLLASRLRRRLIEGNFGDFDDYLAYVLEDGGLDAEWPLIIDQVTTNKTDFFREPAHFDILARQVIPQALGRTRPGAPCRFRLWSAAASTGAEAWSAAMILAEAASQNAHLDWGILGTDISNAVLNIAERAIYPAEQLSPVHVDMRSKYVMTGRGENASGDVRIVPELRRRTRFAELNLIAPPFPVAHNLDAIFLRNVLIYFDAEQQVQVISDIVNHLRIGGWLFVGHAESMIVRDRRLKQYAPAAFRRQEVDA